MARQAVFLENFCKSIRAGVRPRPFREQLNAIPTCRFIEGQCLWLGVPRLEVELVIADCSRALFHVAHELRTYAVLTLIGAYPQTFDLALVQHCVTNGADTHATNGVIVETCDEKDASWRLQLVKLEEHCLVTPAVATSEFVNRGMKDAESTTRRNEFVADYEI